LKIFIKFSLTLRYMALSLEEKITKRLSRSILGLTLSELASSIREDQENVIKKVDEMSVEGRACVVKPGGDEVYLVRGGEDIEVIWQEFIGGPSMGKLGTPEGAVIGFYKKVEEAFGHYPKGRSIIGYHIRLKNPQRKYK